MVGVWVRAFLTQQSRSTSGKKYQLYSCQFNCLSYMIRPLLFLIYVDGLPNATNVLDPIMFADDTNLFYSHHDIKTLFSAVNEKLEKVEGWFTANRLSLNIKKTKYTFFHKNQFKTTYL